MTKKQCVGFDTTHYQGVFGSAVGGVRCRGRILISFSHFLCISMLRPQCLRLFAAPHMHMCDFMEKTQTVALSCYICFRRKLSLVLPILIRTYQENKGGGRGYQEASWELLL